MGDLLLIQTFHFPLEVASVIEGDSGDGDQILQDGYFGEGFVREGVFRNFRKEADLPAAYQEDQVLILA